MARVGKSTDKRRGGGATRAAKPEELDLGTDKLYFMIGEVAAIVDVAAHVLRYWEGEFSLIKPQKSRSQQRVYRRKDVHNLLRIKHLLYARKFTIAGARQELRAGAASVEPAPVDAMYRARASLGRVREELDRLANAIRAEPEPAHLAADPASYLRGAGGVAALLDERAPVRPPQPLLDRPHRDGEP